MIELEIYKTELEERIWSIYKYTLKSWTKSMRQV